MAEFRYEKIIPYPQEKVFQIFKKQFHETFPEGDIQRAIGTKTHREAKGVGGQTFGLDLHITDFVENCVYELTTHSSNQQQYITRYELNACDHEKTSLRLIEIIVTPGTFGQMNAILTQIFFKKKAKQKAEFLFRSIQTELDKLHNG